MEQLVSVARTLREEHDFRGYIHLKTIPEADPLLVEAAGRYADRLSCNIELPREQGLARSPRRRARSRDPPDHGARPASGWRPARGEKRPQSFAPAGQSTQMIVGADGADDREVLTRSAELYGAYRLRRVYYSAFSPIPDASAALPLAARRCGARTGSTRPTGSCASTASRSRRSWPAVPAACSSSSSTPSSPGR